MSVREFLIKMIFMFLKLYSIIRLVIEVDCNLRIKMNELYQLIDNLDCIKKIEFIKNNIPMELTELISKYRTNPSVENKKKLYTNSTFLEYIKNETEINYLIMEINNKFKRKRGHCESN